MPYDSNDTGAERSTQLLSVGQQCSESSCLLVDFLPFKCQHCSKSFCGEHFHTAAHHCPQYDESKHNRVAPGCPLCNAPVAIPPGEDPNIRMERHISTECSVMTGKSGRTRSQPMCARGKCGKVLYAPIACNACKKQFCPQHRFPRDHNCSSLTRTPVTASYKSHNTPSSSSTSPKLFARIPATQTSSASGSRTRPAPSLSGLSSPLNVPTLGSPFSKTGSTFSSPHGSVPLPPPPSPPRSPITELKPPSIECRKPEFLDPLRAKAERESRRKAMLERAKKGLLTEQEKLLLAEEEAHRAQEASKTDKNCTIM